jgi:hypothetical protein
LSRWIDEKQAQDGRVAARRHSEADQLIRVNPGVIISIEMPDRGLSALPLLLEEARS